MSLVSSIILLIATFVATGSSVELRWTTYEDLVSAPWYINQWYGSTSLFDKPSDLDPRLEGLDASFTGNVWGAKSTEPTFICDYILFDADLGENACKMTDINMYIRYYFENPNLQSNVSVWPVQGLVEDGYFLQPSSPSQWSEVYLELDAVYLTECSEESIDIRQSLSLGDIILFDEISIVYSRKRGGRNFCNGMPDGVYSQAGKYSRVWTCSGGHAMRTQ